MSDRYIAVAAAYADEEDARTDYYSLRGDGLGSYTAALMVKDEEGRIHLKESTHAGKEGVVIGAIGGAIVGAIFPPAGVAIIATAAAGGIGVGAISHFAGGFSRHKLKELAGQLENGQAAIVAVSVEDQLVDVDNVMSHSTSKASAEIHDRDLKAAITELEEALKHD